MGKLGSLYENLLGRLTKARSPSAVTADMISDYIKLRSKQEEITKQLVTVKDQIKGLLTEAGEDTLAPDDSPWMLTITETAPKPQKVVDFESLVQKLAIEVYGEDFETDKKFKRLRARYTKVVTADPVIRLNEPEANPNYSLKREATRGKRQR